MDTKSKTDPVEALRCEALLATPRTDAEEYEPLSPIEDEWVPEFHFVGAEFARGLERENAKLRRVLEINADFWARAKSEADAGLIATMRELCSAALANNPVSNAHTNTEKLSDHE